MGQIITFGEWLPDERKLGTRNTHRVVNVVPLTDGDYGPAQALVEQTGDMSTVFAGIDTVTGAIYFPRNNDVLVGAVDAAGASKILGITNPFDGTWYDLSHTTYPTGDVIWNFVHHFNYVIGVYGASSGRAPIKWADGDAVAIDNVVDLGGSPPPARDILSVRNHVMMIGTYDVTDGTVDERVWWSADGDPDDWPTPGTDEARQKSSGRTELLGGGRLVTGKPFVAGNDGVIWAKDRMWAVNRQPAPVVWQFDPIANVGAYLRKAVVAYGETAWWLSDDGFMELGPNGLRNIGRGKVNTHFFDDFDQSSGRIYGTVDTLNSRVVWQYTSDDSGDNYPDRQISYNWITGRWGTADIASHAVLYAPIDTSYDREGMWLVSSNFKLARMTGAALLAELETKEFAHPHGAVMWVERLWPILDGTDVDGIKARVNLRNLQHDSGYSTTFTTLERDGGVPIQKKARYIRGAIQVPAATTWSSAVGMRADAVQFGRQQGGHWAQEPLVDDAGAPVVDDAGAQVWFRPT